MKISILGYFKIQDLIFGCQEVIIDCLVYCLVFDFVSKFVWLLFFGLVAVALDYPAAAFLSSREVVESNFGCKTL